MSETSSDHRPAGWDLPVAGALTEPVTLAGTPRRPLQDRGARPVPALGSDRRLQ